MKFVLIPPGEFTMGAAQAEIDEGLQLVKSDKNYSPDPLRNSGPPHRVILSQPIYLGAHEVTQGQYEAVMGKNPSAYASTGAFPEKVALVKGLDTARHPVEVVSWNDAAEFCAKFSERERLAGRLQGNGYRLPSEAMWEFACRGGTTSRYGSGELEGDLARVGWFGGNSGKRTHAVGELLPNPFGLFDMHGHVMEWCQDLWDADLYRRSGSDGAVDPAGPDTGTRRTARGGGWGNFSCICRSATRYDIEPMHRSHILGFRVALPVEAVKAAVAEPKAPTAGATTPWNGWKKDAPAPAIAPFDEKQAGQHQKDWANHLGVPVEYKNSLGMKFILIPPGEFIMGSTPEEIEAALAFITDEQSRKSTKSEAPRHKVILTRPVYLGIAEVTQAQYEKVIGKNPSSFAATGTSKDSVIGIDTTSYPVENVTWYDAAEFCTKLCQLEHLKPFYARIGEAVAPLGGDGYRLPTEAEWEFACRAGTTTKYWNGDREEDLSQIGWFGTNSGNKTHRVAELKPNPFGLYDMHGNAWEWVQDGWDPTYYGTFTKEPAIDPSSPYPASRLRVLRGSDYIRHPSHSRAANRLADVPEARSGLRVVLTVDAVRGQTKQPVPAKAPFDGAKAGQHQKEWATHLGVPVEYENSLGMKFVLIPPGEFTMGSTPEQIEEGLKRIANYPQQMKDEVERWLKSGGPRHRVILTQPFYLGVHEVTQRQYESVVGKNPSRFAVTGEKKEEADKVAGLDTANHPVENMNWFEATEFCDMLCQREKLTASHVREGPDVRLVMGNGYRLPTEAEWEFACRAGTTTKFWTEENPVRAGWYAENSGERPHAVGELSANPFGLFDTHGNVYEWVQDGWHLSYYDQFAQEPAIDPTGPLTAISRRVFRGGSCLVPATVNSWSSHRCNLDPKLRAPFLGIRVALPVEAVKRPIERAAGAP